MFLEGSIYRPNYILDKDIILVTFNYRLGPIGNILEFNYKSWFRKYHNIIVQYTSKLVIYKNMSLSLKPINSSIR